LSETYLAIFTSEAFWGSARQKTKTPFEFVASALRATSSGHPFDGADARRLNQLGQPLYRCSPPTGYSENGETWLNAGSLVTRFQFAQHLAQQLSRRDDFGQMNWESWASKSLGIELSQSTLASIDQEARTPSSAGASEKIDNVKAVALVLASPEFQLQ
jgi:uncharacterized protein (DUF1800 family)